MIRQDPGSRPQRIADVKRTLIAHRIEFASLQALDRTRNTVRPVRALGDVLTNRPVEVESFDYRRGEITAKLNTNLTDLYPQGSRWIQIFSRVGRGGTAGKDPLSFMFTDDGVILRTSEADAEEHVGMLKARIEEANLAYAEDAARRAKEAEEARNRKIQQEVEEAEERARVLGKIRP